MFLMPVLFLPITIDAFGMGKNLLIMMMSLIGLVIWLAEFLINKKETLKTNKLFGLMLVITIWAWIGWYRMLPGVRMRTLTDLTGVGMMTAGLVWFFLWLQVTHETEKKKQLNWLTGAGVLTAVISIIIFLIPSVKFPINIPKENPFISINPVWSLTGSILSEVTLLLFLAIEWGKRLIVKIKGLAGTNENYILEAITTSFLSLVLFLDIFKMFKNGWFYLDGATGWVTAVETFKRNPIWGAGAGNFIAAFNAFRPDSYNLTANWSNGFLHSNNGILNLWTELGALGMVLVLIALMSMKKGGWKNLSLLVMVLSGLFLPVNFVGIMLLIWVVATREESVNHKMNVVLKVGENNLNIAPWIMAAVFGGVSVFGGYVLTKVMVADVYMRQSLVAAAKNNGGDTYNLQIKAIGLNPDMADYRKAYSQTNLALASTLLANKDITDEDKQKASTLVQQAVRESKAAIALDENNPIYWSNLASIYRQLVGVVDGAADWSYQAYTQAVALEPANAISKLDLGGLLFGAKKYDEADRVFEQVVTAKPDFANGWYNWAYSAQELGKLDYAVSRLTQAVSLVPMTSGDYEKANAELTAWKKELDEVNAKQKQAASEPLAPKAETLKTAEPLPTVGKEQVVVPTGSLQPPVNP